MKKCIIYLVSLAICLVSCRQAVDEQDTQLQTGDLIFVGIPIDYSLSDSSAIERAIVDATGDADSVNYIHVAIVEVDADTTFVIDATIKRGVARYPIDSFFVDFRLKDGTFPRFDVMRLKDNAEVSTYVQHAKDYVGRKYDMCFLPDNDEQYCSELVRNAYVTSDNIHLFAEAPMNFKNANGEYPVYWTELFGILGMPIPQDIMGTNPNDMSRDAGLRYVTSLKF